MKRDIMKAVWVNMVKVHIAYGDELDFTLEQPIGMVFKSEDILNGERFGLQSRCSSALEKIGFRMMCPNDKCTFNHRDACKDCVLRGCYIILPTSDTVGKFSKLPLRQDRSL
jgi:hypothetical protein